MGKLFIPLFISVALSAIVIHLLRAYSLKLNILHDERKIPFVGGLGFSLSFLVAFVFFVVLNSVTVSFQLLYLLVFAFLILFIEIIDDAIDLSLISRVIIQITIIFFFLLKGKIIQFHFLPYWLNYLLSFLWIMAITNAFNLLDIGDGLCGGITITIVFCFLMVATIKSDIYFIGLFLTLAGALLPFVALNLAPARVFMGNSGSHFLGFLLAGLCMHLDYTTARNPFAFAVPLLILALPIIDTLFLIFSRLKRGIFPLRKSNDHIFLRLLSSGWSFKKVTLNIYVITLLWGLSGVLIIFGLNIYLFLFIVLSMFFTIKLIHRASLVAT